MELNWSDVMMFRVLTTDELQRQLEGDDFSEDICKYLECLKTEFLEIEKTIKEEDMDVEG
jgi:hypothetical protein